LIVFSIIFPSSADAREFVTDWYIKDFQSEIILNTDSSLSITEKITADCGNLPNKHGIFRVLPEYYYGKDNKKIQAKITLQSIEDFDGKDLKYQELKDRAEGTITWKIGDPNKTVTGENTYEIKYSVKNTVRHGDRDELYWNLNGNFWDIETDRFEANVQFPPGTNDKNTELNLYSGSYGQKDAGIANYEWDNSTLRVKSNRAMSVREGITLSAVFPDGLVNPYVPGFLEKYGSLLYYLLPLLLLLISIMLWKKYGRDPRDNPTIVPEFGVPEDLPPMELGMIYSDGSLKTNYISAALINLAVKGYLKIEEIPKEGLLGQKDYKLGKLAGKKELSYSEKSLISKIFGGSDEKLISELKDKFYSEIPKLSGEILDHLSKKGILYKNSRTNQIIFIVIGSLVAFSSFFLFAFDMNLGASLLISGLVVIIFSFLMKRRTVIGLKLFRQVQGFKLYMETAEKYRQKFNEKENIFEKFLPYAVMFGMTKVWINKMKEIYGEKYFSNYHPYWYYGYVFSSFNVNNLNSAISDMSRNMAATMASNPSSSGSGGGGFSGGGGDGLAFKA